MASTISKAVGEWATLKAAEQHFWIERNNEILDVKNNIEAEIQEMIGKKKKNDFIYKEYVR